MKATPIRVLMGAALLILLFSLPAYAQDGMSEGDEVSEEDMAAMNEEEQAESPSTDDSQGIVTYWGQTDLTEVEKGFYLNTRFGYMVPFMDLGDWVDGGLVVGGGLGYDILPELSLELDFMANPHSTANLQNPETGYRYDDAMMKGDSIALWLPLSINGHYMFLKRLSFGGGLQGGLYYDSERVDGYKEGKAGSSQAIDYFGGARVSLEYYTGLRHFSLGFDIEVNYLINAASVALGVVPMVKCTF